MQLKIEKLSDRDRVAAEFLAAIGDRRLIALRAPMGAGKTTFTTAITRCLGVRDAVCSPTFTIINEYLTAAGEPMYHFDFYRISRLSEAMDLGLDDYFYSGCLCIMEWPENIEELLPEETLDVSIKVNSDGSRTIEWQAPSDAETGD